MKENNLKLEFYSYGSKKIDFSKLENQLDLDASKPIVVSKDFNRALKSVIEKDIIFLSRKLKQIVEEIKKIMIEQNINIENVNDSIEDINNLVSSIDSVISSVIVSKGSYKVGVFSVKKKEKKQKTNELDKCLDKLTKYQTEIIAIKNEYDKLKQKKEILIEEEIDDSSSNQLDDPLERTINFYLNKQKRD